MGYDPKLGARAYGGGDNDGDAKKGSVRAARDRMQAAQKKTQLPDTSRIIGLPRRPNQLITKQKTGQSPQPTYLGAREDAGTDSPSPQWPLPNYAMSASTPVVPPRSPERLQPPYQNIRPVSDEYPIQQLSPVYPPTGSPIYLQPPSPEYGVSYPNDDTFSPSTSYQSSRPITTSSFASEVSSLGSIPDFPVPEPPTGFVQQNRRTPSLGPPPSSRRGPSSYYTQMSYVSPIVEESDTRSATIRSRHGSYASSNVFPTNKGSYPNSELFSDDDETITSDRGNVSPMDHDDRSVLVAQSPALLRQASLGRRTKPSLMTIKSVDNFGDKKGVASKKKAEGVGAGAIGIGGAALAARDGLGLGRSNLSVDSSSSESLNTFQNYKNKARNYAGLGSPLQKDVRPATLAERAGMRRPPKIDMDAVRDAEARGSLTSLPDLIRRATRLAANLDRGKTASRLGLDFWESGAPEKNNIRQSGLSDMLAAFPPPGQDTPNQTGTPKIGSSGLSKWPSGGVDSCNGVTDSGLSNEKTEKRRRCCGMPLWTFITLLIVALFIIAAAVVIPVVLVVIPNQNKGLDSTAQSTQTSSSTQGSVNMGNTNTPALPVPTASPENSQCDGILTCQNGGVAILNSDRSCNCICINGFTGRTCTNNDATGCTAKNIAGANNATMGSGIPRLIGNTAGKFNVPLNATRILSLFSTMSLSCAAENALITFNGLASRSAPRYLHSMNVKTTLHPSPILHHPHPAQGPDQAIRRQTVGDTDESDVSSNGKTAQPEAMTQPISSNVDSLDFARLGVLFALQESSDLDIAASAQESIQSLLTDNRNGNADGSSVDVGPFKLDLVKFTIVFRNGTTIRAPPQSSSSS
ncbi:hypothetical protein EJ02DRAFT_180687 [Clathrospora elynae]|uniref:EGF-like domain-containing protein n=1 Tax=Clathrospora elynae TaxID=706981 RepID=A0A6A5SR11_9PLEO|nr:hypothetical protein EJ02DRAFT_180687 [Clathrospora elynae]